MFRPVSVLLKILHKDCYSAYCWYQMVIKFRVNATLSLGIAYRMVDQRIVCALYEWNVVGLNQTGTCCCVYGYGVYI